MLPPLLKTKFYIPQRRSGSIVARPQLLDRLNGSLSGKLTLIAAPAGFGKTTLLADWLTRLPERDTQTPCVIWLSLDEQDDDPTRFFTYFFGAVSGLLPVFSETAITMLQSQEEPTHVNLMTTFINEVGLSGEQIVYVLDDYHIIHDETIHNAIAFLLEHAPSNLHLVITSRGDPPFSLARLRARAEMTEIGATDLRFRSDEIATFFRSAASYDLQHHDINALEAETEGWIAGLQLAALSMQGRSKVDEAPRGLGGSRRYIAEYMIEEVLEQQPPEVQAFLLQTSILDRLNYALCDQVMGSDDSRAMLDRIESANLFLFTLDDEGYWYRYHHLFAEVLRMHLHQTQPEIIPELHRRASAWYAEEGEIDRAIKHLLAAGDVLPAAELIEARAGDWLMRGQIRTVRNWLLAMPPELRKSRVRLLLTELWADQLEGRIFNLEPHLRQMETLIAPMPEAQAVPLRAIVDAFFAHHFSSFQQPQRALEAARRAFAGLAPEDAWHRANLALIVGYVPFQLGNAREAEQAYIQSLEMLPPNPEYDLIRAALTAVLGNLFRFQGKAREAEVQFIKAMKLAERDGHLLPIYSNRLSLEQITLLLHEMDRLDEAEAYANTYLNLCEQTGIAGYIAKALTTRALLLCARGDFTAATDVLAQADATFRQYAVPYPNNLFYHVGLNIALYRDDLTLASEYVDRLNAGVLDDAPQYTRLLAQLLRARLLLAQGSPEEALDLALAIQKPARAGSFNWITIHSSLIEAAATAMLGRERESIQALDKALNMAAASEYIRWIFYPSASMSKLLRQAQARGIMPDFIDRVLACLPDATASARASETAESPLTERELEVLQLVADGLSDREIAQKLYLALGTVKRHLSNVYGKLDVNSRTQALSRARELNLL
ncbi:MAG: hypothetical protein IT320_10130 [Anaerolineae bacterium]|nr:hypothetical protein [Anaerolineae bacterium]